MGNTDGKHWRGFGNDGWAPPRISPQRLMAAGAIRNSFQNVKDQLPLLGFDFGNPDEPQAVEWASARSK